jgi:hypothetical protein
MPPELAEAFKIGTTTMPKRPLHEQRRGNLTEDLDVLLQHISATWGFCDWAYHFTAESLLQEHPNLSADVFSSAVVAAEGHDSDSEWYTTFKKLFLERYGEFVTEAKYRTSTAHHRRPKSARSR